MKPDERSREIERIKADPLFVQAVEKLMVLADLDQDTAEVACLDALEVLRADLGPAR